MAVTVASFRADFPLVFRSQSAYPNESVTYWLAIAALLLNQNRLGASSGTASSPPTTTFDFLTELFVAHNLIIEKQAADTAAKGGDPGTKQGMISSKSVGSVSIGYTVAEVAELDGGYWNATVYGARFLRLARMFGSGPVQIGIGYGGGMFNLGGLGAWAGPYPGIMPSDTGFG
jgi:hypothetical protein